jgi:hypothetical protein
MTIVRLSRTAWARPLLALAYSGCSSPTAPPTSKTALAVAEGAAVAAARRDERQKLMQEYWYEHAVATGDPEDRVGRTGLQPLLYPAGNYSGLNFATRQAADSSLAEPVR